MWAVFTNMVTDDRVCCKNVWWSEKYYLYRYCTTSVVRFLVNYWLVYGSVFFLIIVIMKKQSFDMDVQYIHFVFLFFYLPFITVSKRIFNNFRWCYEWQVTLLHNWLRNMVLFFISFFKISLVFFQTSQAMWRIIPEFVWLMVCDNKQLLPYKDHDRLCNQRSKEKKLRYKFTVIQLRRQTTPVWSDNITLT